MENKKTVDGLIQEISEILMEVTMRSSKIGSGKKKSSDKKKIDKKSLLEKLRNAGINVYKSSYGWGFTDCECDCYSSEGQAIKAALRYLKEFGG